MSIGGRIRDLLGGLLEDSGDTTLDDLEDDAPEPPPRERRGEFRSRPTGPGYQARRPSSSRPSRPGWSAPDPRQWVQERHLIELYRILEVPVGADLAAVKASYRRLLRQSHPDLVGAKAGSTERVQALNEAYSELCRLFGTGRPG